MKTKVILLTLVLSMISLLADNDGKHITFINQTKHKLTFKVHVTGPDRTMDIESHNANYYSLHNTPGSCGDKKYKIDIIRKGKVKKTVHRKCGEDLYVWIQDKEYKTGFKPNPHHSLDQCVKDENRPAILFAHGFNDSPSAFRNFAPYAKKKSKGHWRVFRTAVSQDGSIKKRAHMLAKYIIEASEKCNIKDESLRVVTHSMGGLDIRYLVSNANNSELLKKAAKKIERIYTLAAPHQGHIGGGTIIHTSDAAHDLGKHQMKKFNEKYPYSDFKVGKRKVDLLAIRFRCKKGKDTDGVVNYKNQKWLGAPYSKTIYKGRHMLKVCKDDGATVETNRTKILGYILKDNRDDNGDVIKRGK